MKKAMILIAVVAALTTLVLTGKDLLNTKSTGFQVETMKNGMDIITFESNKVPLVTICLTFKAGGMTETPELNGLTHLWEHMFFKGNKKIPTQEGFRRRIRQLGISYNGDTSSEKVRYFFTLPSAFLDEGLEFMADAIRTPNLSLEELEKERIVVMNEYQRSASSPSFLSRNARRKLIYGSEEYQRDPLGKKSTILAATKEHLDQIKKEVFVPKNGALIIGGAVSHDRATKLVKKYFADWKNPAGWTFPKRPNLPKFPETASYNFSHNLAQDAKLLMTYYGPKAKIDREDSFAADMLIGLLRHKSGKFYNKYINSGKVFDAGISYYTQSHAGELNLYSHNKAGKTDQIKKDLLKEIELWSQDGYFTLSQLEDVKRGLLIHHKMDTAKPSEYIKNLAFWWSVTGLDYYGSYIENLKKVSIIDIQNFVKKYLINKPRIETILYSKKDAKNLKIKLNGDKYVSDNLKEY
jgi:zinc protease